MRTHVTRIAVGCLAGVATLIAALWALAQVDPVQIVASPAGVPARLRTVTLTSPLTIGPGPTIAVDDPAVKNFVVGMEMTQKSLLSAFENNGLKKIDPPKGEKFDPHQHQAMMEQPAPDVAAGGVIQVLQPGYELLGRLIRPAMVVVAAKGSGAEPSAAAPANPYAANDGESGGSVDTKA